jgi:Ca2+-binding RTX toxin-like protein
VARQRQVRKARTGAFAGAAVAALLAFPGVASAAVTSSVTGGTLNVASNAGDPISIACAGGNVQVNGGNPGTGAALCNTITTINVVGGPGDNLISLAGVVAADYPNVTAVTIEGAGGNDTITGSDRADLIDGGDGNDRIIGDNNPNGTFDDSRGGPGDDTIVWNPGDGSDINVGGDGSDTIEVNGGGGNEKFSANPAAASGGVRFERSADSAGGFFSLDITTAERLDMNANNGDDSFTSEGAIAALGFALDVDGGGNNDTLDGGDGPDLMDGGDGNDKIDGDDNPANTQDVSRGGPGDDTMTWNPGDDDDVNEGGDGNDTSVVNGATGDEKFEVKPAATAGRVDFDRTDPAPFSVDIGTTENLLVNADDGNDRIRGFAGLAGLIKSTFNGDDGNDAIRGTDGEDALGGGKGHDVINSVDKAADAVECGNGFDLALVDRRDTIRACELAIGGRLRVLMPGKPKLDGDAVAVKLHCIANKRCKSKVVLRHDGKTIGKNKLVRIGDGNKKTVRVKLNKRGLRVLAADTDGKLEIKVRVDTKDKNGNGWRVAERATLNH